MKNDSKFKSHWIETARERNSEEFVFGKTLSQAWSREKDVQTFKDLQGFLELPEHTRILDVGCGPLARAEVQCSEEHQIVGLDISRIAVKHALRNVRENGCNCSNVDFVVADAEALPLQNRTFNVTFCIGTICHLPTKECVQKTIQEISRITTDQIFVPWWINQFSFAGIEHALTLPFFDLLHISHAQYLRFNGMAEIQTIFQKARLSIQKIRYGNLLDLTWILNFSPKLLKIIIHRLMRQVNRFHIAKFASSFEITSNHSQQTATQLSYHEFL